LRLPIGQALKARFNLGSCIVPLIEQMAVRIESRFQRLMDFGTRHLGRCPRL